MPHKFHLYLIIFIEFVLSLSYFISFSLVLLYLISLFYLHANTHTLSLNGNFALWISRLGRASSSNNSRITCRRVFSAVVRGIFNKDQLPFLEFVALSPEPLDGGVAPGSGSSPYAVAQGVVRPVQKSVIKIDPKMEKNKISICS